MTISLKIPADSSAAFRLGNDNLGQPFEVQNLGPDPVWIYSTYNWPPGSTDAEKGALCVDSGEQIASGVTWTSPGGTPDMSSFYVANGDGQTADVRVIT